MSVCRLHSTTSWTTHSKEWDHITCSPGIHRSLTWNDPAGLFPSCTPSCTLTSALGMACFLSSDYILCFHPGDTLTVRNSWWTMVLGGSCREEAGALSCGPAHGHHRGCRQQRGVQAHCWVCLPLAPGDWFTGTMGLSRSAGSVKALEAKSVSSQLVSLLPILL